MQIEQLVAMLGWILCHNTGIFLATSRYALQEARLTNFLAQLLWRLEG